jgi:hypothetical protein
MLEQGTSGGKSKVPGRVGNPVHFKERTNGGENTFEKRPPTSLPGLRRPHKADLETPTLKQ